ncbi:MAG: glycosyltransferase family 4 protein [Clostridia bacterium]|nr:glycosyltransferase family 4 protein [Clostridia bacterium]
MKIYEIGTGYTPVPAQVPAATESVVEELTKAFMAMEQPVEILDISTTHRAPHDLPITEVAVPSLFTRSDVSLGIVHKVKRVVYSLALAAKLKKILKAAQEKVVLHFHNQYNAYFFFKTVPAKLRDKAVIAYTNHNGYWSLPWSETCDTMHKRYFQEIDAMKRADKVFVLNPVMRNNVIEQVGIPSDRVVLTANGVNTALFHPLSEEEIAAVKAEYGLAGKRVILQVGSVNENKGQGRSMELLAPLLKKDKNVVFAYAGGIVSAEYHQQVQKLAQDLDITDQVIYLGMVSPGEQMNRLYNIAEATIFASKYEGFALVSVESLSAGVPALLCSQLAYDFGDGSVHCATAEELEKAYMVLGTAQGAELRRAARENAVRRYSWTSIAQEYSKNMFS